MPSIRTVTLFPLLLIVTALHAEVDTDPRGDRNVNDVNRNVRVDLRIPRRVFSEGEAIPVLFRVTNAGHRTVRLYPFSPEEKTFRFELLDVKGRELDESPDLRFDPDDDVQENRRMSREGERAREILLEPGETYERRIYLDRHYELRPGEYRVSGFFLPDARHEILLRTVNRLRLRIEQKKSSFTFETRDVEETEAGPDAQETVYLFLSAELSGNMKNYFKYLDLPRYILSYDLFARDYVRASSREREAVMGRFTEYLKQSPADPLKKFQILRTVPESKGRVRVDATAVRSAGGFRVEYLYNFYLEKDADHGLWKITGVVAGIRQR